MMLCRLLVVLLSICVASGANLRREAQVSLIADATHQDLGTKWFKKKKKTSAEIREEAIAAARAKAKAAASSGGASTRRTRSRTALDAKKKKADHNKLEKLKDSLKKVASDAENEFNLVQDLGSLFSGVIESMHGKGSGQGSGSDLFDETGESVQEFLTTVAPDLTKITTYANAMIGAIDEAEIVEVVEGELLQKAKNALEDALGHIDNVDADQLSMVDIHGAFSTASEALGHLVDDEGKILESLTAVQSGAGDFLKTVNKDQMLATIMKLKGGSLGDFLDGVDVDDETKTHVSDVLSKIKNFDDSELIKGVEDFASTLDSTLSVVGVNLDIDGKIDGAVDAISEKLDLADGTLDTVAGMIPQILGAINLIFPGFNDKANEIMGNVKKGLSFIGHKVKGIFGNVFKGW